MLVREFFILGALLLVGCFEVAPPIGGGPDSLVRAGQSAVEVLASDEILTGPPAGTSLFSLAATRDLYLYTRWDGPPGAHVVRLQVYTPGGALFHKFERRFRATDVLVEGTIPRGGGPGITPARSRVGTMPAREMVASGSRVFWWKVPVLGATIDTRYLVGSWTVKAFLDRETQVAAVMNFELAP